MSPSTIKVNLSNFNTKFVEWCGTLQQSHDLTQQTKKATLVMTHVKFSRDELGWRWVTKTAEVIKDNTPYQSNVDVFHHILKAPDGHYIVIFSLGDNKEQFDNTLDELRVIYNAVN